ncbi:fatty acid-binding protein 2, liver-like [Ptychodera flava]|uniref:fatty acid-binding protein 2, liver-like n=1 Tax=Ptychodera flava TaxID=63121 RepID=UPI00396A0AD1
MAFAGNWTVYKSENVEKFMLAAGAPADRAANAEKAVTTLSCKKDGDFFILTSTGPKGNTIEQKFKPGVPFTESFGPIGKERQAIASIEGNKLVIKSADGSGVTETREVNGDEMVFSISKDGIGEVGRRYLKRS